MIAELSASYDDQEEQHQQRTRQRATIRKLERAYQPARKYDTIDEARAIMNEAIHDYLSHHHPHILLCKLPAGTGKTTMAVRLAEQQAQAGHTVLYAAPRHDFWADVMGEAQRPDLWHHWLPRRLGTETQTETCRYAPQINEWLRRGYPARRFCTNPTICGYHYMSQQCPWHAQARTEKPILFAQHPHLTAHPLADRVDLIIVDEFPLSAFLTGTDGERGRRIAPNDISMPGTGKTVLSEPQQQAYMQVSSLVARLRALCESPTTAAGAALEGPALLAEMGGPHAVLHVVGAYRQISTFFDGYDPPIIHADEADTVPVLFLPVLMGLLEQEASMCLTGEPYIHRLLIERRGLRMLLRRAMHPDLVQKSIICLDATGDARLYREMFQRPVKEIAPDVPMKGRVFQVTNSLNAKSTLLDGARHTEQAEKVERQIERIINENGYRRPAVVAYQSILNMYGCYQTLHYYANRGTNRLGECDALLVIGAPSPGHAAVYDLATMLFQSRTRPFPAPEEAWVMVDRPFVYEDPNDTTAPGRSIISAEFADSDLQAILWQHREAEIIQSVHRARPVLRDVDVWLLTNLPVDELPPARLLTVADLFGVPVRMTPDGREERPQIDPYMWPDVLLMADIYCSDSADEPGYLAPWHLIDGLNISRAAANRYIRILIEWCGYMQIAVTREGTRRPAVGCTRINISI